MPSVQIEVAEDTLNNTEITKLLIQVEERLNNHIKFVWTVMAGMMAVGIGFVIWSNTQFNSVRSDLSDVKSALGEVKGILKTKATTAVLQAALSAPEATAREAMKNARLAIATAVKVAPVTIWWTPRLCLTYPAMASNTSSPQPATREAACSRHWDIRVPLHLLARY